MFAPILNLNSIFYSPGKEDKIATLIGQTNKINKQSSFVFWTKEDCQEGVSLTPISRVKTKQGQEFALKFLSIMPAYHASLSV